jgi:class 3 adenylate cyclase
VPTTDIHGIPRRHGFGYGAQLLSLFREETIERRLAAILVADVVGYSRLMGEDEVGKVLTLNRLI